MFSFGADEGDVEPEVQDERIMGLKPMNCPYHMLIFAAQKRSYRELPLRICDQGVLHRNEVRALGGLTGVGNLSDDAHLFVTEEQIEPEVTELLALVGKVYQPSTWTSRRSFHSP